MEDIRLLSFLQMYIRIRREPNLSTPYVLLDTTVHCFLSCDAKAASSCCGCEGGGQPPCGAVHLWQQAVLTAERLFPKQVHVSNLWEKKKYFCGVFL